MENKRDERIGMKMVNNQGLTAEIVDYVKSNDILVRFDDGTLVKTRWAHFNKGLFRNPNVPFEKSLREERLGEENINKQGCLMKIIEYHAAENVIVQFDNDPAQTIKTSYEHFKQGKTRNPFTQTISGIGVKGSGHDMYKEKEYITWHGIIDRCYSANRRKNYAYYDDCTVCEEFLYYPNFYNWITQQENYEAWRSNPHFHVDKDILYKGNREYAPDKCCLVPNEINNIVRNNKRGQYLPGVRYRKSTNKYSAECSNANKHIYIGTFDTEYEAFLAYKKYKEAVIKQIAEREYANGMISKECRDALMRYEIEVTD